MDSVQMDLFDTTRWKPKTRPRGRFMKLLALIRSMESRPRGCFASVGWFASRFGVCERTVKSWIQKLRNAGMVFVQHRGPKTAVYTTCPPLSAPQAPPAPITEPSVSSKGISTVERVGNSLRSLRRFLDPRELVVAVRTKRYDKPRETCPKCRGVGMLVSMMYGVAVAKDCDCWTRGKVIE